MSIRDTVYAVFRQVAESQDRTLAPMTDDLRLTECGLDSLSFAIVVASLEDELNTDPFASSDGITFPNTLGDFVKLYERAPAPI
ncbi:MAG TPA: phosphopantetheine-binding protein [Steroidobacteraceae bacterium]|nr:phosphopantetheine-binding protein [Steroidobacteraceae bacterium]